MAIDAATPEARSNARSLFLFMPVLPKVATSLEHLRRRSLDLNQGAGPTIMDFGSTAAEQTSGRMRSRTNIGGDMRKLLITITVLLLSNASGKAEEKLVVDMSRMTCRELARLDFQDFAGVTMWLSGYYNASVHNTVVDLYQFAQAAKTVKDFCQTSPQSTVMSAAERALGIKMPRSR
ncbi:MULTISPECIES: HdeA/HdeB family chaperone [Bradyrhizobium]